MADNGKTKRAGMEHEPAPARENKLPDTWRDFALACGVEENDLAELGRLTTAMQAMHRRKTSDVFDTGSVMVGVAAIVPEEKFGEWVKQVYGYTRTHVVNFMNVHTRLGRFRSRFEAVEASSTALTTLANQDEEKVEAVLTAMESGQKLTVAAIKKMLVGADEEQPEAVPASELAGAAGVAALTKQRTKVLWPALQGSIGEVMDGIESALGDGTKPKRIVKSELGKKIEHRAKRACAEARCLLLPVEAKPGTIPWVLQPVSLPTSTGWGYVIDLLDVLGDNAKWPTGPTLVQWLRDTVVPALLWALGSNKGRLPALDARAVPGKANAAAAETPVVNAEPAAAIEIPTETAAVENDDDEAADDHVLRVYEAEAAVEDEEVDEPDSSKAVPTAVAERLKEVPAKPPRVLARPSFLPPKPAAGGSTGPAVGA